MYKRGYNLSPLKNPKGGSNGYAGPHLRSANSTYSVAAIRERPDSVRPHLTELQSANFI